MPKPKIVHRLTEEAFRELIAHHFQQGRNYEQRIYADEAAAMRRQKELLNVEQTKAVTALIEACNANLGKAGYLIGKLNKDNSR
jgi:hypothetical protein